MTLILCRVFKWLTCGR